MSYQNRDLGIGRITARPGKYTYGGGIGIMLVDEIYPAFPGDVRNPSAYPFPIQYDIVQGVDIQALVYGQEKSKCLPPILEAAERLEKMGVRAIAAECGYFAYFQREVAAHVSVPVFMSSLLQLPLMQHVVGLGNKVGVVCARHDQLTPAHLESVGVDPESNIVFADPTDGVPTPEFANLWNKDSRPALPTADYVTAEDDMARLCRTFVHKHPDLRALLFECTGFQPFARAVQREVDLPIYTWSTLLEHVYSVVNHREYYGHV